MTKYVKKPKVRFSVEEDEHLIEFVRNHPILYDISDPEFKDNAQKDRLWNKLGTQVSKEGLECKLRWKNIKDHVKRERKDELKNVGRFPRKRRATYWDRLQFIYDTDDRNRLLSTRNGDESVPERIIIYNPQEYEEVDNTLEEKIPESNRVGIDKILKKRKKNRLHINRCFEDVVSVSQPLLHSTDNEIDLFFKTMAATVKKFRPDLATKTKSKVFKVVTDMELLNQDSSVASVPSFTNVQYIENCYSSSSAST